MKKFATALLVLGVIAFASAASAAVLMTETFSYPDGGLVAVSGGNWATHSGSGDITVVSGKAAGDMALGADDNRTFTAQGATAKTYACFLAMIPTPAAAPVTNYFAHLKDTGTSNFAARVGVVASGATFTFALGATSFTTPTAWPTALNYNQWYIVATSYDAATGTCEMWIDPANELSPKITVTGGTTGFAISSFALRQSNTGGTAWKFSVDDIGVGTSFTDACQQATPTSQTTWGRIKQIYR